MLFTLVRNPFSLAGGPDFFNNMEHSYNIAGNEDPKDSFFNNMTSMKQIRSSIKSPRFESTFSAFDLYLKRSRCCYCFPPKFYLRATFQNNLPLKPGVPKTWNSSNPKMIVHLVELITEFAVPRHWEHYRSARRLRVPSKRSLSGHAYLGQVSSLWDQLRRAIQCFSCQPTDRETKVTERCLRSNL